MAMTLLGRMFELKRQMLMVFSVGRCRIATPADDVASVRSSSVDVPIPSRTPFLRGLLRDGDEVAPVYDFAARLNLHPIDPPLYVIAKHFLGPLAVCVDGDMPTVHDAQAGQLAPSNSTEPDILGTYLSGSGAIPIYSLAGLGGPGYVIPNPHRQGEQ
jgi:chemotaxis signal transduction protein